MKGGTQRCTGSVTQPLGHPRLSHRRRLTLSAYQRGLLICGAMRPKTPSVFMQNSFRRQVSLVDLVTAFAALTSLVSRIRKDPGILVLA